MIMNKILTFIDLFAGIGGFHIAFEGCSSDVTTLKCIWASEWDNHARLTYETNFKKSNPWLFENNSFSGDITKVKPKDIPDF